MNNIPALAAQFLKPKFYRTRFLRKSALRILDIGIANNSYLETKSIYPKSSYSGVDMFPIDFAMQPGDDFFLANLENSSSLDFLGQHRFDLIIINHVLEHLSNGDHIYRLLCQRLNPGGFLYAELPSLRTAYKPKTRRSYHFHDDPTHCRVYHLESLANIAMEENNKIVSCGQAGTPLKMLLSIPRAVVAMLLMRPSGSALLFLQGKIDYILIARPKYFKGEGHVADAGGV